MSDWLRDEAKNSFLLQNKDIITINNCIETAIYKPQDKKSAREKFGISGNNQVILFGADNINNKRKGVKYLLDSLFILKETYTKSSDIVLVLFGKNKSLDINQFPFNVIEVGKILDENTLIELYSSADVFVLPSIEDNLPNTIVEASCCGLPTVAFNTGGIPEMILHKKTGYLAELKSSNELAKGIQWILEQQSSNFDFLTPTREFALSKYSSEKIVSSYQKLYEKILAEQSV